MIKQLLRRVRPRLLPALLLLTLLSTSLPLLAKDYDFTYQGVKYQIISETYKTCQTAVGYESLSPVHSCAGELVLPANPNGYRLIAIGNYSFKNCEITSVTIPNSVTSIGQGAFRYCSSLTSVTIPNSVKSIGENAFGLCRSLTSLSIPNSVISIGAGAFSYCSSLKSINVNEGNSSYCSISGVLFSKDIDKLLTFPAGKVDQEYTIPNSVKSIGESAFGGCSGLTSVTIPNSVISIGEWAFYNCSSLTSVTIPNSVTSIGSYAFSNCSSLFRADFESIEALCKIKFGNTGSNPLCYAHHLFISGKEVTELTIPNSVTSIGSYAFSGCSSLTSVTIPNLVTTISEHAFYNCSSLTSVTIPNSVKSIGDGTFSGCSSLNNVYFNAKNCTSCGSSSYPAFPLSIKSVIIGSDVQTIPSYAFYNCKFEEMIIEGSPAFEESFLKSVYGTLVCRVKNASSYKKQAINAKKIIYIDVKWDFNIKPLLAGVAIELTDNPYYREGDNFKLEARLMRYSNNKSIETAEITDKNRYVLVSPELAISVYCSVYADDILLCSSSSFGLLNSSDIQSSIQTSSTQTSLTFKKGSNLPTDESFKPEELGFTFSKIDYPLNSGQVKVSDLMPGTGYSYTPFVIFNGGKRASFPSESVTTKGWNCSTANSQYAPTSAMLTASFREDDAKAEDFWWMFDGQKVSGQTLPIVSLTPNSSYNAKFYISYKGKTYSFDGSFSTSKLEFETLAPKGVSSSCAIVAAKTNISDWEPMAGFEWKKYDAPASLAPSKGYGAVCDGVLEGYIKNLQATSYYNVRPFYQDAKGNFYYGEWITFDPSDFSYFEPTVRTYPVQEVTASSATVRGYALSGTDNIKSQGFQYWRSGASKVMSFAPADSEITTVPVSGQIMTATFDNLAEGTTYTYRAYVETEAGFTYGEEQSFTTKSVNGLIYIETEESEPTIIGYYDLTGRRHEEPQPGFNIVVYSNGQTRKIMHR